MGRRRHNPGTLVLPDGSRYRLAVMKVLDTYDDRPDVGGLRVPAEMLFVDEDDAVELSGGERFVAVYVPESVFGRRPGR